MANDKKGKRHQELDKRQIIIGLVLILIFILTFFLVNWYFSHNTDHVPTSESPYSYDIEIVDPSSESTQNSSQNGEHLLLHMINCGQGDSFLFEQNGKYGMIDCGTKSSGKKVVEYLQQKGVKKLNFIVGTHQHDDHLGGMQQVIENFKCDKIYMPKIETGEVVTNWYINLMKTIKEKNIKVINPKVKDRFKLGDTTFTVVGQFTQDEANHNINNYSTVIKVSYGDMDVLMTGDAEIPVEKAMIDAGVSLECEILKVGHHGSTTSTSKNFLKRVSPEYALISCAVGNKFEHPCKETMDNLKKSNVKVYRTDENNDVIVTITKNDISFSSNPGDYMDGEQLAKKKGVS